MQTLFLCDGIRVEGVLVPQFKVAHKDHVGFAFPREWGVAWDHIMEVLSGSVQVAGVKVSARTALIARAGLPSRKRRPHSQTILDFALAHGVSRDAAERIITDLGLPSDIRHENLAGTPRTLMGIRLTLALNPRAELLVFSTSGLDPLGVKAVGREIAHTLDRCAALHVFWAGHSEEYAGLIPFTALVRCESIGGER